MREPNFENICVRLLAQFFLQSGVNHQHALGARDTDCRPTELGFNLFDDSKESVANFGTRRRRSVCPLRLSRILPRLPDYRFGSLGFGARSATE
jgi:hypothetical protein